MIYADDRSNLDASLDARQCGGKVSVEEVLSGVRSPSDITIGARDVSAPGPRGPQGVTPMSSTQYCGARAVSCPASVDVGELQQARGPRSSMIDQGPRSCRIAEKSSRDRHRYRTPDVKELWTRRS